ncbi:MAG: hypothetical protein ABIQ93_09600, partial [Saprospiraceae bacterium]
DGFFVIFGVMKTLPLLLLALLFHACSHLTPQSEAADCNLPSPSSDTAQFADFKQHMLRMGIAKSFIPHSDTMYCFRGRSGWGEFDYLCTVYSDSTGYKAAFTRMTNPNRGHEITFEALVKPIGPLLWKQIQADFEAQNFWCNPYHPDKSCIDANEYYFWSRKGKKFRLVNWNSCEPKLDFLKILSKKLRELCGFPLPSGEVIYSIDGDSIHALYYVEGSEGDLFFKSSTLYCAGKQLPGKGGIFDDLTVPKKDLKKLEEAEIILYGIDGSVNRCRVSSLRKR